MSSLSQALLDTIRLMDSAVGCSASMAPNTSSINRLASRQVTCLKSMAGSVMHCPLGIQPFGSPPRTVDARWTSGKKGRSG